MTRTNREQFTRHKSQLLDMVTEHAIMALYIVMNEYSNQRACEKNMVVICNSSHMTTPNFIR